MRLFETLCALVHRRHVGRNFVVRVAVALKICADEAPP
jgi:hypothetical protein